MSKNSRSLIRSSLFNLRRLWQRREEARRDVRRSIGTSFEPLEPRLALAITAPLPSPTDHIHPVLQIYLEGQQVVLPTDIGLTTSGHLNPHTHDLTGTLHIGEGGPAGIGSETRTVRLSDFFDVWRTAGGPSGNNANAIFDTDLTDGTNQPRIMGQTVNPSTHVLRVYVKESGDSVAELEYASNQSSNNLARPELYVPRDGDQIIISLDKIANTTGSPSFEPIGNQTVLGGAPTWLGIDGFDPTGGPLTYTVQVSNPNLLTATINPSTNKSMVLNVENYGQMTFQLFNNLTPNTAAHFEQLVNSGQYNSSTSTPVEFYRIAYLSAGQPFVIQGGRNGVASSLGRFDDEYHKDLQFTNAGLLAMAKSSDDTNDAEIFVTGGPARFLDMQHTIFGVLTDGNEVRQAIQNTRSSGDGPPPSDIVITSSQIITDNQNAALMLKAAEGASGTATVTLTVRDAQNNEFSQTFTVTIAPDTANSAPFLNPIAPVTGSQGQPITIQLTAQDVENNANFFDASKPANNTVDYQLNVNNQTGLVTITPPANFVGTFQVSVGVRGQTQTTTADQFDTQLVTVTVGGAAPTLDLDAGSDSGSSSTDNITNDSQLDFVVSNVTAGATVKLLKGTTVLAEGVVASGATTITLSVNNPATALGQGVSALTATQTVGGQTSSPSAVLNVTYDTSAPTFSSTAPTAAQVGFDLAYNAQTNEEGSGVVYSLSNAPGGATINPTTGVVSWTPTSASSSSQSFNVIATDAAGNAATQQVTLTVATPKVDFTITLTKPDGSPLTSLAAGQDFILHFFAADVRDPSRGVFAAYTDITFDGTKATVTGPITYSNNYSNGKTGTTSTSGLIDDAGAFAGTSDLGSGPKEVFSIPMRATAAGTLTFTLDPSDVSPATDVLVYGQTPTVPDEEIHYGTASITVGNTFNAVNDTSTVNEDTQNNVVNPLANDTSVGGASNTLTISAVGTTSNGGTVTITQNNTRLSYTPAPNFTGTETFTYTARNQSGEEHIATVTMTVTDVNDPPVATNDTLSASRNSSGNVLNVLANDTMGVDSGETLRVTAVGTGSRGGTITIGANGANIIYTPAANTTGAETFTYTISDRATGGLTSTATVTVNISGLTAAPDTATVAEDSGATTINVLANDQLDPQIGGTLTITNVGAGSNGGTITITENSTRVSYTPAANFQGTETFTYTISDGQGNNATSTVTVTVTNSNDAPVATNDTLTAFKDTATTLDVLANDNSGSDPTENLIIDSVTQPANGTVTIIENGKKISFTPASGFSGATSFTYTIKDPGGLTATATANVTVEAFSASVLSGFVYFDVNNNGIKDAGEIGIAGVTITITGTATSGSTTNVNQTVKTFDDGSYKFESLAPGNYTVRQTQPAFTIDGRDSAGSQGGTVSNNQIVISSLAQGTTGINNNFGELGRTPQTISLRDFFSSTSRNYAHAAFDSSGNELWHALNGSAWNGHTATQFSLTGNKSQIRFQGTNGDSQSVSKTFSTSKLPVYQNGGAGGNVMYYIPANAGTIPSGSNQSPTANSDSYSTPVGTALTVTAANGVLKNDTDPENNTLVAILVSQPANGTLSLSGNGAFTFTPTNGFTGTTTFTYRVSDGNSDSLPATVTISVGTNGIPTANNDAYNATEDAPLTVTAVDGVLKNDTDPENNTLTAVINTQPSKGTVSLASDGSFTYTPNANANGTDTFTYRASDSTNQSNIATVTITIAPTNDAPVAQNDNFFATRNTTLTQAVPGVLANDTDPEGATLTVTVAPNGNPTNGTLTLNANGSFTYTPNNNFTGTDTFTYRVSDGSLTADAIATITVNPPGNQAPVANNDTYTTTEDTALTVQTANSVLQNDTDAENNTLTAVLVNTTTHGTLSLASNGTFTYTPNANFNGTDSFTYRANDGTSDSTIATVTITVTSVNDTPVGNADNYNVDPNTTLTVPIGSGVLANDTDGDNQTLTAIEVDGPSNGTLSLNANGSFTYIPNNGFEGTDTFTYKARDPDNAESAVTTVTIRVNAAPVGVADSYQATEDTTLVIPANEGVLSNDTDPSPNDTLTAMLVSQPENGTVSLNADGSFTYTPNANFTGTDSFRYQASDGGATSDPVTVSINVAAANDAPTTTADSYSLNAGATLTVTAAQGVLENDEDVDNDQLSAIKVSNPANGTVVLLADGSFSYTPNAGFHGPDTFVYRAEDGRGGISADTTVTINVNAVPEAENDEYGVNEDTQLIVNAATGVLSNDTDADNGTLTATIVTQPQHGTVTLLDNGSFTYTPNANYNGPDGFSYTVSDGQATSTVAAVTINVNPVNDSPVRSAGNTAAIRVAEDSANETAVTLGLTSLDYSPGAGTTESSQTLTYRITSIPSYVTLFKADGTTAVAVDAELTLDELRGLTYKTVADAVGTGNITWSVKDDGGTANGGDDTLTDSLAITVGDVNEAPVRLTGSPVSININEDSAASAASLGLSGVTYGPGGGGEESSQTLTYKVTSIPSFIALFKADGTTAVTTNTTLTLSELQSLTFKTVADAFGSGSITWTVQDDGGTANGGLDTLTETLSVTVQSVNDAPTRTAGNPAAVSVVEDSANTSSVAIGLSALDYGPGGGTAENSQTLTYRITSIPTFVTLFKSDGTTPVSVNDTLTLAELRGLRYKTVANANGTGTLGWSVQDDGGIANGGVDTLTQTLSMTVTAVNDAPELTAGSLVALNVAEDSAGNPAASLGLAGLTYGPGGGAAEASQTLTYRITAIPSFINLFKADGTTPVNVNTTLTLAELRSLRYRTVANASGTGSLTFSVQDSGGTASGGVDSLSQTLAVTVNAVNDAPERTAGNPAVIRVNQDSANTTAVALGLAGLNYSPGGGSNESSQTLTYRITNIPSYVTLFKADGITQVTANSTLTLTELQGLRYKTVAGALGTGNITWTVQDSGGTASGGVDTLTETLAITVGDVNEAPVRTAGSTSPINVHEDSANTVAATLGFAGLNYGPGGGSEEASQTLTYRITSIPNFITLLKADGTTTVAVNTTLTLDELRGLRFKTLTDTSGTGSLTWSVKDTGGTANSGVDTLNETLSVTVQSVNDAPTRTAGNPAAISVLEDSANTTAASLGLSAVTYGTGGGSAESSQTLTYKITAIPTFVTVVKADGTTAVNVNDTLTLSELQGLRYKTVANANGTGNLAWSVQDNGGTANGGIDTLTQTLGITVVAVNDAPERVAGTITPITAPEDSATTNSAPLGLASLTYGPGGGAAEAAQVVNIRITAVPSFINLFKADGTTPVNVDSLISLAELRTLRYKTVADATGTGNITWSVQDNGGTANGGVDAISETLAITITSGVNEAPTRTDGEATAITVNEDSANATAANLGLSDLEYDAGDVGQNLTYVITSIPSFVTVFQSNGSTEVLVNTTLTLAELQGLTYKTVPDASGSGSITWTVKDDGGTANSGVDTLTETLSITVNAVNDAPARTAGDAEAITVDEDAANGTAVTLGLSDLEYGPGGGASEADQELTFTITAIPSFVTLYEADGSTEVLVNATLTLAELQGLMYKTVADDSGSGNISWSVKDDGGTANGGVDTLVETLSLTVNAINDAPLALNDTYAVDEDGELNVSAEDGVLDNDDDPDGDPLTAERVNVVDEPANGTLAFNADGSFTYTPDDDFFGTDFFTYRALDDELLESGVATVTITVNPVNDAPVAQGESYTVTQDTTLVVGDDRDVLQNDSDVDNTTLSAVLVTNVATGTLDLASDGTFTYTPAPGTTGQVTFTYKASDGNLDSNEVTVTIDVQADGGEGEGLSLMEAALLSYLGDSASSYVMGEDGDFAGAVDELMGMLDE